MKFSIGFALAFLTAFSGVQAEALAEPHGDHGHDDWKAPIRTKTVTRTRTSTKYSYVHVKPKTVTYSKCTKTTTQPSFTRILTVSSCPRHPHHGGKDEKTLTVTKTSTLSIPGAGQVTTVSVPTTVVEYATVTDSKTVTGEATTITIPGEGEVITVSVPTTVISTLVEPTTVVSTLVEPTTVVSTLVEPTTVVSTLVEPTTVVSTLVEPTTVVSTLVEPTTVVEVTTTTITEPTTVVEATTTTEVKTITATPTGPVCTVSPGINNGGFETGVWNTDGWTLNNASGSINWSQPGVITNEQARSGSQSLKMATTSAGTGFSLGFKKVIQTCTNTNYKFTAWAKALTGSTRGNCQAYVSIDNVPMLLMGTWPNSWTGGAGFFNSGARTSISFRIDVYCVLASGPNEAIYWDDISVEAL